MRIYEDPQKTSKNRLAPRAYYIPGGCAEYRLLNGDWRFRYYSRDIDVPESITDWEMLPVPSCWQLHGYEHPNYTNINYPYPCDAPYVPDDNPCGVYERDFMLDTLWGKVYFILEGVSSCAFVSVNGTFVGFTQGSHLQAEFDITPFVHAGSNTLRVKVLKWCCGSYLEDQDCFRYNGIFRDCYLLQRPENHITDLTVTAKDGHITVRTDKTVNVSLSAMDGSLLGSQTGETVDFTVENPICWNAEKPYLYTVTVERDGEIITQKTGFRTIAVSDTRALLINGVPVKLHGVNHHDTHPRNGWCETNEELRQELLLMKSLHINCIRTSHYPPTPYFLELCDEIGFYVVLETDLETHGFISRNPDPPYVFDVDDPAWLCQRPEWQKEYVERMQRAVLRDRNHPSIIIWSTGNESGYGKNHEAMLLWTREQQDGRLLQCEDASRAGKMDAPIDLITQMYWDIPRIEKERDTFKKPFFLCEYAHAMGNGPGDVYAYNELFDTYDDLIGGCIWEWADHVAIENGVQKYGGDFEGELTHDGNFCCDGMVFADRTLKAGSLEIKTAYQPMKTRFENGILSVYNRFDFTDLAEYTFVYTIECDGNCIEQHDMTLSAPPHTTVTITPVLPALSCTLGAYLNCYLKQGDTVIASTQHPIPATRQQPTVCTAPAQVTVSGDDLIFTGARFRYVFSKHYGNFTSLQIDGVEQLAARPGWTAFRAPTDNDCHVKVPWNRENIWQKGKQNAAFSKVYSCTLQDGVITVEGALAGVSRLPYCRYRLTVTVAVDGAVQFDMDATIRENAYWLPRFGLEFAMPGTVRQFRWFGHGPGESYCDLHHYAPVSMYNSDVDSAYVPYVRPQEHGNHFGVRLLQIGKLQFTADRDFECNVSKYSTAALTEAEHTDALHADGLTHVRVDYRVSGIGSHACGPKLMEPYRMDDKQFRFAFTMQPN